MGLVVNRHQMGNTDLGIFLGGGQRFVAEQFLDGPQIGASIEQMSGEGMPQGVGRGILKHMRGQ